MAGILESLAAGLRQAGGVLNPAVQGILANESSQDEAYRRAMQTKMFEQRIADERERALGSAVGPSLMAGNFEEAARAAAGSGAPGGTRLALDLLGKAEERKARSENLQMQLEMKGMDLRQKHLDKMEELRQRGADAQAMQAERIRAQRELAEFQVQARRDMVGLAASLRQPPQPPQPQLVTNETGVFQIDRTGNAVQVMGPDGSPLAGKKQGPPEKALPASAAGKLLENQQNLRRADQALALLEGKDVGTMKGDKNATGIKGYAGETILQRTDTQGIDARAALADLGSLVIHDRSGAAVTAAEFPRLRPFIPQVTDDPETARKKLRRFRQVYQEVVDDTRNFYRDSGYKVPDSSVGTASTTKPATPAPPAGFKPD